MKPATLQGKAAWAGEGWWGTAHYVRTRRTQAQKEPKHGRPLRDHGWNRSNRSGIAGDRLVQLLGELQLSYSTETHRNPASVSTVS